jgi:hypothetical protein
MATDIGKQMDMERNVLGFSIVIVRFLTKLKNFPQFKLILVDYEGEFYQHLLDVYCRAYNDFCFANKQVFAKLFGLSQMLYD